MSSWAVFAVAAFVILAAVSPPRCGFGRTARPPIALIGAYLGFALGWLGLGLSPWHAFFLAALASLVTGSAVVATGAALPRLATWRARRRSRPRVPRARARWRTRARRLRATDGAPGGRAISA